MVQLSSCISGTEAASLARRASGGLIVCHIDRAQTLSKFYAMYESLQGLIRENRIRCVVTNAFFDAGATKKLGMQFGVELLGEPVTEKSLLFKINRLLQNIPRSTDKSAATPTQGASNAAPGSQAQATGGQASQRGSLSSAPAGPVVRTAEALSLESDCWLLMKEEVKNIAGKWVLRLRGPHSRSGQWVAAKSTFPGTEAWQWVPKDPENDPYIKEEGAWIFQGDQPDGNGPMWIFKGKRPNLSFFYDGENYGSKLSPDTGENAGGLVVAADSEAARKAHPEVWLETRVETPKDFVSSAAIPSVPFEWGDPLELESDCWLLETRTPKRAGDQWTISLLGPSPQMGKWVEVREEGTSRVNAKADSYWSWIPSNPENDPFIKEEGAWVFFGQQPRFNSEGWIFTSQSPELAFYYDGESYGNKFGLNANRGLVIAKDSPHALKHRALFATAAQSGATQGGFDPAPAPALATGGGMQQSKPSATASAQASNRRTGQNSDPPGRVFRFEKSYFSREGGEWESAGTGSQSRRWFMYVPYEVLNAATTPDIRKWGSYWLYFGPSTPRLEKEVWFIAERKPQRYRAFTDLPKNIQEFALKYFGAGASGIASTGQHRIPVSSFDEEGGEWEAVDFGSDGRRWYAFVPMAAIEGRAGDIRKLRRYWIFFGSAPPRKEMGKDGEDFIFDGIKPKSVASFSSLPAPIRDFFMQFFSQQLKRDDSDADAFSGGILDGMGGGSSSEFGDFDGDFEVEKADSDNDFFSNLKSDAESQFEDGFSDPMGALQGQESSVELDSGGFAGFDEVDGVTREGGEEFGEAEHRQALEFIGTEGGVWVAWRGTNRGKDRDVVSEKDHVYIPKEVLDGSVDDIQGFMGFWTYRGKSAPRLINDGGSKFWVFKKNEPVSYLTFDDLEASLQRFLQRYTESLKKGRINANGEILEGEGELFEPSEAKTDSIELGSGEAFNFEEEVPVQEVQAAKPSQNLEQGLWETGQAPRVEKAVVIEPAPVEAPVPQVFKPEIVRPDGPVALKQMVSSSAPLNPLGIAMLMSELIRKKDLDRKMMASRFCDYLSSAVGGLRAELWIQGESSWFCGGASQGGEGQYGRAVQEGVIPGWSPNQKVFIATVLSEEFFGDHVLGAVMIESPEESRVKPEYAQAMAKIVTGLVISLSGAENLMIDQPRFSMSR